MVHRHHILSFFNPLPTFSYHPLFFAFYLIFNLVIVVITITTTTITNLQCHAIIPKLLAIIINLFYFIVVDMDLAYSRYL